jgi:hypothetical protein
MTAVLDFTDLPLVSAEDLALPMRHLIESGRGLALIRGLTEAELEEIDRLMWEKSEGGDPVRRLATVLRFRALAEAFASHRLQNLFLQHGLPILPAILEIAAGTRLNVEWGFNPHKFARALQEAVGERDAPAVIAPAYAAPMTQVAIA